MRIVFAQMIIKDYEDAIQLGQSTPGMGLSGADSKAQIEKFLIKNPGLSFVAKVEDKLVGTLLCGHDGRRGYLYHLAVDEQFQRQGIGSELVKRALNGLQSEGIQKCHLFVYVENQEGLAFWNNTEWVQREELVILSHELPI